MKRNGWDDDIIIYVLGMMNWMEWWNDDIIVLVRNDDVVWNDQIDGMIMCQKWWVDDDDET